MVVEPTRFIDRSKEGRGEIKDGSWFFVWTAGWLIMPFTFTVVQSAFGKEFCFDMKFISYLSDGITSI